MLALGKFRAIQRAARPHHVTNWLYHVKKVNGCSESPLGTTPRDLQADNMRASLLVAEDAPDSQNLLFTSWSILAVKRRKRIGALSKPSGMAEGKGRIGGARATGGSYRPVFHGLDRFFSLN